MKKLITMTNDQENAYNAIMRETRIDSYSQLLNYLALFYEQNQKKAPGRPRLRQSEDDAADLNSEDTIEMYQVPDKFTTSPYSYNDLIAWYEAHPEAGSMPDREELKIHKSYKAKD